MLPPGVRRELERRGARFVLWREVNRSGRPTKIPLRLDGGPASSTDPASWATLGGHRVSALVGMILDDGRDALDRLEAAAAELGFVRLLGTGDEDEGAPP